MNDQLRSDAADVVAWYEGMKEHGGKWAPLAEKIVGLARHVMASHPADEDEWVDEEWVAARHRPTPDDGTHPRWYWMTDRVFLVFNDETGACNAGVAMSTPEDGWKDIACIDRRGDYYTLCRGLKIPLKETA